MRPFTILAFVLAALSVTSAHAGWPRLPALESKPVGMQLAYAGTSLQSSSGITDASTLLSGDANRPAQLSSGRGEATLKFAKQSIIRNVSFVNDGIEGKVTLLVSSDDNVWIPLANTVFAPADRLVKMDVGRAQGRYVRLSFELSKGGGLRDFQLIGGDMDTDYLVTQNVPSTGASLNFATGIGGGRLIYLSENLPGSGLAAVQSNTLQFSASTEKIRTAVYDLGQVRSLEEFGSLHSPDSVRFSVYAFDKLPEKENWRGRLSFDPSIFVGAEPVAVAEDRSNRGQVTVKPSQPVKSRFIALRWETDSTPAAFTVFGVSLSGLAEICFKHPDVVAMTTADSKGEVVTTLVAGDGRGADAERAAATAVAYANVAMPPPMAGYGGALSSYGGSLFSGKDGKLNRAGERRGKLEGEDDPDPEAIHILWCPIASP